MQHAVHKRKFSLCYWHKCSREDDIFRESTPSSTGVLKRAKIKIRHYSKVIDVTAHILNLMSLGKQQKEKVFNVERSPFPLLQL